MTIQACILEIKNAAKNAGVELLEEEVLDILDILEHRFRRRGGLLALSLTSMGWLQKQRR